MVVGQTHDLQARHLAFAFKTFQLSEKTLGAFHIRVVEVPGAVPLVEMPAQCRHARDGRLIRIFRRVDELAITAIAEARLARAIPEIAAGRTGNLKSTFAWVRKFPTLIVVVTERPGFLHEIGRVSAHSPFMAIGADFRIDIEIVQQNELARQRMMIWRDLLGKQAKLRIAIPFGHVAEHLIVGAIFFNHVDHIFNWTCITGAGGNWAALGSRRAWLSIGKVGTASVGSSSVLLELLFELRRRRQIDDAQRARK